MAITGSSWPSWGCGKTAAAAGNRRIPNLKTNEVTSHRPKAILSLSETNNSISRSDKADRKKDSKSLSHSGIIAVSAQDPPCPIRERTAPFLAHSRKQRRRRIANALLFLEGRAAAGGQSDAVERILHISIGQDMFGPNSILEVDGHKMKHLSRRAEDDDTQPPKRI